MGGRAGFVAFAFAGAVTAFLLTVMIVHRATIPIQGGDVFWQLRTGQMILETGQIPDTETFSYTAHGTPWNNHEWLYELALASWHQETQWAGVRMMVLFLIVGTLLLVSWPWLRERRFAFALLHVCVAMVLIAYKFLPAPQTVAMFMFFVGYRAFLRDDLLKSPLRYLGLCLFMLLFGNLTAESLMFIPFVFVDQLQRAQTEPKKWFSLIVRLAFPAALVLVTPPQSSILEYILMRGQSVNAEFAHLWEPAIVVTPFSRNFAWLVVIGYIAFVLQRTVRGRTIPAGAGVGLMAVVGALLFQRNLFLLALPVEQLLRAWPPRLLVSRWRGAIVAAATLFASFSYNVQWQPMHSAGMVLQPYWFKHISATTNPVACLDAVRSLPAGSRVFTTHLWASYLILYAQNVRIFVDGRNREYPEVVHRAAFQIQRGGPAAVRLLKSSHTQWVLLDPGWLARIPPESWQLLGRGPNCALYAPL